MSLLRDMTLALTVDSLLASPGKVRLLRTLYSEPRRAWSGRELARAAGVSSAQCARDLVDLLETGLLSRDVVGRTFSWRLNGTYAMGSALEGVFAAERDLLASLRAELAAGLSGVPVVDARLFGSVARGEDTSRSDIDLFVEVRKPTLAERAREALDGVRQRIWQHYGLPLNALVYTTQEIEASPSAAFFDVIRKEGLPISSVDGT